MKTIVMLGTVHRLQQKGNPLSGELDSRLGYLAGKFQVQVILEEWTDKRPSSAADFARSIGVGWSNVGTPDEEMFRTLACPPVNHPGHDGTLEPDEDAPSMLEYGPIDKQENREARMLSNIRDEMSNYDVGLFMVGLGHLHSMASKLLAASFHVVAYSWLGAPQNFA